MAERAEARKLLLLSSPLVKRGIESKSTRGPDARVVDFVRDEAIY
jgi:hypothetical protein